LAKFLDVHSFHSLGESAVKKLQLSPPDEFGVKHLNILYNKAIDLCFCYLDAPDRESVEKHHEKVNLKWQKLRQLLEEDEKYKSQICIQISNSSLT
jgi:hypothetical protein